MDMQRRIHVSPETLAWIEGSEPFQLLLTRLRPYGFDVPGHYEDLAACIEQGWDFTQVERQLEHKGRPLVYPGDALAGRQITRIAYDDAAAEYRAYLDTITQARVTAAWLITTDQDGFDPLADEGAASLSRRHW